MKIQITKTFGNLKKGQVVDRSDATALKLVKLGHAMLLEAKTEFKELKDVETKKFKGRTKTK